MNIVQQISSGLQQAHLPSHVHVCQQCIVRGLGFAKKDQKEIKGTTTIILSLYDDCVIRTFRLDHSGSESFK